eukprot:CAMPEP_0169109608 /NCGR_PEP_ID=MMETSP1015-20121227/26056_1 /TAXON_ID=342587 /ORGANISM="Karlodinium micrum, Strain CCMP2283" /LENGTH=178 /DNA_ID=CAMNT_0009171317 /DNA_START=54 /DNA_END=590 /DNA_ORIENTATION=-
MKAVGLFLSISAWTGQSRRKLIQNEADPLASLLLSSHPGIVTKPQSRVHSLESQVPRSAVDSKSRDLVAVSTSSMLTALLMLPEMALAAPGLKELSDKGFGATSSQGFGWNPFGIVLPEIFDGYLFVSLGLIPAVAVGFAGYFIWRQAVGQYENMQKEAEMRQRNAERAAQKKKKWLR